MLIPTIDSAPNSQAERLSRLAHRMKRTGQWHDGQAAGRRWTIGCVSLEITQRCNLDCTLCYLSDSAEAVRDIPLEEIFKRIDHIALQYGRETDIQISGGDPTLRDKAELSHIVRYIRAKGMRASLLTNGILLTRPWLKSLAEDGLNDVAFHVDMTQERKGYASEADMNALRRTYIEMARGLPLSVIFNTTVYEQNMHEIPLVADFFTRHNDVVRFASFQLGADTGRGTVPGRDPITITQATVRQAIEQGAGVALNFDALQGGHKSCNKYAMLLTVGKYRFDALADGGFVARLMCETADIAFPRGQSLRGAWSLLRALLRKRQLLWGCFLRFASLLWRAKAQLLAACLNRGKLVSPVRKISFFIHNFMDACDLDDERVDACVFMAATAEGPISMCAYNAQRERILLKPIVLANGETWQPLAVSPDRNGEIKIPLKWLKGKPRETAMAQRLPSDQRTYEESDF